MMAIDVRKKKRTKSWSARKKVILDDDAEALLGRPDT